MHCCVLGSLSCSLFLHMSFELKLLLLLLWLVASCSLFLHSHAWLSDCLVAHLYQSPLDSRYVQSQGTSAQALGSVTETGHRAVSLPHRLEAPTRQKGRGAGGPWGTGSKKEAIGKGQTGSHLDSDLSGRGC